ENIEVVLRIADRVDGAVHGENERVAGRASDVVSLERGGGGQHDVGVARGRRPPALVHDHRLRLLPGALQGGWEFLVVGRGSRAPSRPGEYRGRYSGGR